MDKKILVVDDDRNIVELLRLHLERAGYQVVLAFDGQQAVAAAHKEKPDLILLDIMLPAGSGLTVMDLLKMSAVTAGIPVIAISAIPQTEAKEKLKKYSIIDFLPKPILPEKLLARLEEYFYHKK